MSCTERVVVEIVTIYNSIFFKQNAYASRPTPTGSKIFCRSYSTYYASDHPITVGGGNGIMKWRAVSYCPLSVRLSVCHVPRPNSRMEMHRKPKIGRMEAPHTSNPWTYLEVKKSRSPSQLMLSPKCVISSEREGLRSSNLVHRYKTRIIIDKSHHHHHHHHTTC